MASIDERRPPAADASSASEQRDSRLTLFERAERLPRRTLQGRERASSCRFSVEAQQAFRRGIHHFDAFFESQNDDARGGQDEDFVHQEKVLFEPRSLGAQLIDHPVVDADQSIHLRLACAAETRSEVLVADQLGSSTDQLERNEKLPDQRDARERRENEEGFGRGEHPFAGPQGDESYDSEQDVYRDEIREQLGAKAHRSWGDA